MESNNLELQQRFPELRDPEQTIDRIAEAFVAPEYARAAFGLMRRMITRHREAADFGGTTVVSAPYGYEPIFVTLSQWWALAFHTAPADELENADDVEHTNADDFDDLLRTAREEESDDSAEEELDEADDADDELDDDEIVEMTYYQVGTFLLDSTIIPKEEIFDREDLDCYAYDFPEERIEAERFYWARMVWEPADLSNEDLLAALDASFEFVLANHRDTPYAEFHDSDFAQLILDEALCERAIGTADFGDVVAIDPSVDEE